MSKNIHHGFKRGVKSQQSGKLNNIAHNMHILYVCDGFISQSLLPLVRLMFENCMRKPHGDEECLVYAVINFKRIAFTVQPCFVIIIFFVECTRTRYSKKSQKKYIAEKERTVFLLCFYWKIY